MSLVKNIIKFVIGFIYWRIYRKNVEIRNYLLSTKSTVGKGVSIRRGTYIYGKIEIGDYSYISGPNTLINNAKIGKYCSIARNVTIGPGNHNLKSITTHPILYSNKYKFVEKNKLPEKNLAPKIGHDVWIGVNAIILNNVNIGNGAIIGAGAIVTKDVEPYSIVGGIPARHIKYRFTGDIIKKLLEIQWWNWSEDLIKQRINDFDNIELFVKKYINENSIK